MVVPRFDLGCPLVTLKEKLQEALGQNCYCRVPEEVAILI